MGRDDDRGERRSWKDIDRGRDGSGGSRRDGRRNEPELKGPGYSKYKADLDRLFDLGMAQGHVGHVMAKAQGDAPGEEGEVGGRAALVRACRLAEDHASLVVAVDALLETGGLPDDLELMLRVCDHPDEAVATDALERIERLTQRNPLKRKAAFLQRLYTLEQTAESAALRDVVNRLIEQLA